MYVCRSSGMRCGSSGLVGTSRPSHSIGKKLSGPSLSTLGQNVVHESVMEFVTGVVDRHGLADAARVLEIGSLDVNGSVRSLFSGDYTGVDRKDGKGVDHVGGVEDMLGRSFDVVVSTSALEHDPAFWFTLEAIRRILNPGGYFILTTVSWGFFEHDKPDYYRFMPDVYALLMELAGCDVVEWREDPQSGGPQMLGRRHGA